MDDPIISLEDLDALIATCFAQEPPEITRAVAQLADTWPGFWRLRIIDVPVRPRLADRVAGELRDQISSGVLASGAMLPPARELAARFGVGQETARTAVGLLCREGLLVKRPRCGRAGGTRYFVADRERAPAAA